MTQEMKTQEKPTYLMPDLKEYIVVDVKHVLCQSITTSEIPTYETEEI